MDRKYISVYALNKYIKAKMNQDVSLQNVYIKGEISNYRPHPSGHLYFTLKDQNSRVSAIMFSTYARTLDFEMDNGIQVLIKGNVSVYEVNGQYQLYVQQMQQDGIGNLYLQYEKLKKQLEKEGLFDKAYKKAIPTFPKSIAVLAGRHSDAVQDVVRTIYLRFPFTKVIVFPIPVQGKEAYINIVKTLNFVDTLRFDTIIIARGGGSIEDLWNFNEEALARCIFALKTPIISGVGHETDFTICDFVSDYRALTPTAAALIATPDQHALKRQLDDLKRQLSMKMQHKLVLQNERLTRLKQSYYLTNPDYLYTNEMLRLTHLKDRLTHECQIFDIQLRQKLQNDQLRLKQALDEVLKRNTHLLQNKLIQLDGLSPLKVMQRGYTFIQKDKTIIKNSSQLNTGDEISIIFHDGQKNAKIK